MGSVVAAKHTNSFCKHYSASSQWNYGHLLLLSSGHRPQTHTHTLISPWNVKVKCKRLVPWVVWLSIPVITAFSTHQGVLESPWFSHPHPGCQLLCRVQCNCNSLKAVQTALQLSASLTTKKKGKEGGSVREGREGEKSPVSRTLSHSGCIWGNILCCAGLMQTGATMSDRPVVSLAVQSTHTHPHQPLLPLNLHPG